MLTHAQLLRSLALIPRSRSGWLVSVLRALLSPCAKTRARWGHHAGRRGRLDRGRLHRASRGLGGRAALRPPPSHCPAPEIARLSVRALSYLSPHAIIVDRDGDATKLDGDYRCHAVVEGDTGPEKGSELEHYASGGFRRTLSRPGWPRLRLTWCVGWGPAGSN